MKKLEMNKLYKELQQDRIKNEIVLKTSNGTKHLDFNGLCYRADEQNQNLEEYLLASYGCTKSNIIQEDNRNG